MTAINVYAKALIAAIVSGYGAYQVAATNGAITQAAWVQIALTVAISLAAVWGVPNAVASVKPAAPVTPDYAPAMHALAGVYAPGGPVVPPTGPEMEIAATAAARAFAQDPSTPPAPPVAG